MDRPGVAGSRTKMLPLGRGQIFEQLDLVPITLQHCDRDFCARHTGDFTGEFTGLMWSMRKLEPEHIPPESERPFKVRHGNAGVVGGDDTKGLPAHVVQASFKSASLRFQMLLSPGTADLLTSRLDLEGNFSGKPANQVQNKSLECPSRWHARSSAVSAIFDKGLTAKFCLTNCTTCRIGRWNSKDCHERAHLLSCPGASPIHSETGHA